ncbi:MAG TPA: branched-chain amino acid ABC transporter substrate-binding protein [Gaiellaceae bacterium]
MRRLLLAAALAAGVAVLATAAFGATKGASKPSSQAASATALVSCKSAQIGGMFPLTGPAPGIGDEQRNWAVLGLDQTNKALKTKFKMLQRDTMLSASEAATVAQELASNGNVLAVVGPAGSQEVVNAGPVFTRAKLPFVSSSATRTVLTDGSIPTFSRDVPNDSIQGPTIGKFTRTNLKAKRVVVIDDQTSYGAPLADGIEAYLKSHGATVTRKSVPRSQSDFSALVTSIPSNTQVVVLAWQVASNAQQFARQMREQAKSAKIFGSDGLFDPAAFTVEGAYVSIFAPVLPAGNKYAKAYAKRFHKEFGSFGPPAYVATEIEVAALKTSCKNGTASRAEVAKAIRKTKLKTTPLGAWKGFTAKGDPKGAHFYIYKIVNGKYKRVF